MSSSDLIDGCVTRGAAPWAALHVPVVFPDDWTPTELALGLRELERLQREVDAATAQLVGAMPDTRDSATALARTCGVSNREARRRRAVADVAKKLPQALALLRSGQISAEHVAALAPVASLPGAASLLDGAASKSPEDLRSDAEQFRLDSEHGEDNAAKQRARRMLRFFDGPDGMIGLSGLLPPVEGATLKARLKAIVDSHWRANHPERAPVNGGHGGDTREQRMADALLEITGVAAGAADQVKADVPADDSGEPAPSPTDSSDVTASDMTASDAASSAATERMPVRAGTPVNTGKPAVVIVFDITKWRAELLGHGPIPVTASVFDMVKADLYYAFTNMTGEILKFGRAKRDPTPILRLAVIARDRHCIYPDCHSPPEHCEIHHLNEIVRDSGHTDVESLGLFCLPHHHHLHAHGLYAQREPDGTITIRRRDTGERII